MSEPGTVHPDCGPAVGEVLDLLPTGACILAEDFSVCAWNHRLADGSGMAASDVIGRDALALNPTASSGQHREHLQAVFAGGQDAVLSSPAHEALFPLLRDRLPTQGHSCRTHAHLLSVTPKRVLVTVSSESEGDAATERHHASGSELAALRRKHREIVAMLRESQARTEAIVLTAVDGIITFDDRGRIGLFNPASERMFHYAVGEILGRPITALVAPPHRAELARFMANPVAIDPSGFAGSGDDLVGCNYNYLLSLLIREPEPRI